MGRFQVYHIDRDGAVTVDYVSAKTKAKANRLARERFDDVVKVKRTGQPWLPICIAVALTIAFVALFVMGR